MTSAIGFRVRDQYMLVRLYDYPTVRRHHVRERSHPPHDLLVQGHGPCAAIVPRGRGLKKGALSAFIEDAVRWRLFEQTVETIKDRNAATDSDALMALIGETVRDVRAEHKVRGA